MELPSSEPVVRVRLESHGAQTPPRAIGAHGQPLTIRGGGAESSWDGPVDIARGGDGWIVSGRGGPLPAASVAATSLDIEPDAGVASALPASGGQDGLYPGSLRAVLEPDGAWLLINVAPMEVYLPGVLQAELFAGWPESTYKAQAIAARSYAAMQVAQRSGHAWDVTDTAATQAYMGDADDATAIMAARSTRGQVLSWNGGLVPGYFCSCCGGLPATGVEAVGTNPLNAQPPLGGHAAPIKCAEAPVYTWTRTVDAEAARSSLRAWGREQHDTALSQIGPIESIETATDNRHGRSVRLRITDRQGHAAEIDAVDITSALFELPDGPPMSGWFTAARKGSELELRGRGFGHGVGLCQYGAAAMGDAGATADEIVHFYYPGAAITTAW